MAWEDQEWVTSFLKLVMNYLQRDPLKESVRSPPAY
jgi:hypothetical protein